MTSPPDNEIVVAHQLGPEFERLTAPRLPAGVRLLALPRESRWDVPHEATVLVVNYPTSPGAPMPATPISGWPRGLCWVQTQSTGVDNYSKWLFETPVVTCARGLHGVAIAEFVLASMLTVEKHIPDIWVTQPSQWKPIRQGLLKGKTLGLLGFGGIGAAIAERALAFGMTVLAHRRTHTPSAVLGVTLADFDRTIAEADHLVLAVPLTKETHHLIGAEALSRVKPTVHIVNIARGAVLDQEALLGALDEGRVGFATLDVTTPEPLPDGHPLYAHPKVNISPHVSAGGSAHHQALADFFLANLTRFLNGQPLEGIVSPEQGY